MKDRLKPGQFNSKSRTRMLRESADKSVEMPWQPNCMGWSIGRKNKYSARKIIAARAGPATLKLGGKYVNSVISRWRYA
jgi:hypothetical protein